MRVQTGVIVATIAIALWFVPPAAAGTGTCGHRTRATTVRMTPQARVYTRDDEDGLAYYACARPGGRPRWLGIDPETDPAEERGVERVATAGSKVAWATSSYSRYYPATVSVRSVDLRTGSEAAPSATFEALGTTELVVWSGGHYAVRFGAGPTTRLACGQAVIAEDPAIDPGSLRKAGREVAWRANAVEHRATCP